jgi:hypothetical protein
MPKARKAMFLIKTSEHYDLKNVADLRKILIEANCLLMFPFVIPCDCGKGQLLIRSLDDFPDKSVECPNCSSYLLRLVKVVNGKTKTL